MNFLGRVTQTQLRLENHNVGPVFMQLLQSHLPISPNISRHGISANLYYSTSASSLELHIIKKPQALVYFFSNSTFLYAIFTEDWILTRSNHFRMIPLLV